MLIHYLFYLICYHIIVVYFDYLQFIFKKNQYNIFIYLLYVNYTFLLFSKIKAKIYFQSFNFLYVNYNYLTWKDNCARTLTS